MKNNLKKCKKINYIDSSSEFALLEFKNHFFNTLQDYNNIYEDIVLLCIGTDRATGDSLGPLIGYKLSKLPFKDNIYIYGTLNEPIHAKNLKNNMENIYCKHKNCIVVAIDASLGSKDYINFINIGLGSVRPGAGVNKNLPPVGDIFITGIVNHTGLLEISVLQNTRLSVVMNMADIISYGIWHTLS